MNILFDYQIFTLQKYGGISRCFVELYKNLPLEIKAEFGVRESDNVYLQEVKKVYPSNYKYKHFICNRNFRGKGHLHLLYDKITRGGYYPNYNQNYSIELLKKSKFEVFHPTYFSDYFLPYLNGKPFVLTIHDMIPELYPQYFGRDDFQIRMRKKLAPLASAIVTVSESTKRDVIRILNVPEEKVHVVYHGCSFPDTGSGTNPYSEPYVLYVGARWAYKNFDLFVRNLTPVLFRHPDLKVVCTGSPFNEEESLLINQCGVEDRFINHWVNDDGEFFTLYHNALCFVYPSEYEGFGIPILEAYKADCPVMLNRASCFPEIAGDAAIYFDMTSEGSDLDIKIEQLFTMSSKERANLLCDQRKRLNLYSWDKSAKKLSNIYQSVLTV